VAFSQHITCLSYTFLVSRLCGDAFLPILQGSSTVLPVIIDKQLFCIGVIQVDMSESRATKSGIKTCIVLLALLAAPSSGYASDDLPGPESVETPVYVRTRFYWPRFATARVVIDEVDNDRSLRYSADLYLTPRGKNTDQRIVRMTSQQVLAVDGVAVSAVTNDDDKKFTEYRLRLSPACYLDENGNYLGCENVAELVKANLSVLRTSAKVDSFITDRLTREVASTAGIRDIRQNAAAEMLEWAGWWSDLELIPGKPRIVERHLLGTDGKNVLISATCYIEDKQVDCDGVSCSRIWFRTRLTGEAFNRFSEPYLRRLGLTPADVHRGELVITASILADPYSLLPMEVTAQYNTIVEKNGEHIAGIFARKAVFEWEKGKDPLIHAGREGKN